MWPFSAIREARQQAAFWRAQFEEWHAIAWEVSRHAPEPVCRTCGGTNLAADAAAYYTDAKRFDGAPLMCLDCEK